MLLFISLCYFRSKNNIKYLHFIGVDNLLLKPLDPLLLGLAAEDKNKKIIQKCVRMNSNEDEDS